MRRFPAVWAVSGLICLSCLPSRAPAAAEVAYPVGDFTLTERDGREVHASDLRGKVWIASFIFTRCSGPCPRVTATMEGLQTAFAGEPDVRLVTFTVDPEFDSPEVLRQYAKRFHADPDRWLFLTGKEADIYSLLRNSFKVTTGRNTDAGATAGEAVVHSTRLAVVDRQGRVRDYFPGIPDSESDNAEQEHAKDLAHLRGTVERLLREGPAEVFPPLNAALNAAAGILVLMGYAAVRRRRLRLHAGLMLSALAVSAVFLASYLYYHLVVMHGRPTSFADQWPDAPSWVGYVYLSVLASHTLLAIVTAPLALYTAYQGLRGRLARHVAVARWTLPIWLYVSITGVVVYWMLYRLY